MQLQPCARALPRGLIPGHESLIRAIVASLELEYRAPFTVSGILESPHYTRYLLEAVAENSRQIAVMVLFGEHGR